MWALCSHRFGARLSFFVSISIGVAASFVILLPMSPHLFWCVLVLCLIHAVDMQPLRPCC
jgi:hypothetical protein